jgi:hypothetical protein
LSLPLARFTGGLQCQKHARYVATLRKIPLADVAILPDT